MLRFLALCLFFPKNIILVSLKFQIGQYLMTLPQHLEPFLFRENPSLSCALKAADPGYSTANDVEGALADVFLSIVANGICQHFTDRILSIRELNHAASRQLSHDISKFE